VVSFIVPVRNDAVRLERCLRSIKANESHGPALEILVVDNGSTDRSPEVARSLGARVITSNAPNVAELRNLAARQAHGHILAFVDADHEITATWTRIATATVGREGIAAAGALCHSPIDGTWVQRAYGVLRGVPVGVHDVEWLGSGNLAVQQSVFHSLGGFDTSLTTCEDVDLCNRIRAAGHRIVSHADMKSTHYGDPDSLWAVFKGELWRGRDNLRVSLRAPLTLRGLPSIVIPIGDLGLLCAAGLGLALLLTGFTVGLPIALACVALVLCGASLKVVRSAVRSERTRPVLLLQAWVVACAYDVGRALALVARTPHRNTPTQMAAAQ
jgi:hypothetical protein